MYNVTSASAAWNILTGQRTDVDSADGSFSEIFGARLRGTQSTGSGTGIQDMLAKLAERFPNAKVTEGAAGEGTKAAEEKFGVEEGDNVAVDSNVLSQMFGNNDFFKQIEDALSSFFNSDAGANPASGSYSQRNVSISITVVTFSVTQRAEGSGELLSSQDLQSSLQAQMKELIERVFGRGAAATEETTDEESDSEDTSDESAKATDETNKSESAGNTNLWKTGNNAFSAWSMQMYYSNAMIQSMGNNSSQNSSMQSFFASYQSYSSNLQDFTNSYLPQSIYDQMSKNSSLSGPFTSLFEGGLGQLGLTSGGFSQTTDGYQFSMRNGRDFLSEFLEMTGRGKNPAVKETTEGSEVEAAVEASEAEEVGV